MNYPLLKDVLSLIESFDNQNTEHKYASNLDGFKHWLLDSETPEKERTEPSWEGKEEGRSPESVINTLLVHLNRYARTYSKSAIYNSAFSTQEEFTYLINLKAFGAMSKMQLINKNIQDKPVGMQIIDRLLKKGWVLQTDSQKDRRTKLIDITEKGRIVLESQMKQIRRATQIVTGDLSHREKMELIRLLDKLDKFHQPIFQQHYNTEELLDKVYNHHSLSK